MTTFPTSFPFRATKLIGVHIARRITRSTLYKELMSKFDVIHLNDRAHPYTTAASDIQKPKVLTIHWIPSKIDEDTFTKMDGLVSPSEFISKTVNEMLGLRPIVIPHGVDTTLFNTRLDRSQARRYLRLPESKKVILWIGRVDPNKDLKTLIEAVPRVAKEVPDSLFVIKGRTTSRDILQQMKERLRSARVERNVKMMIGWDFITKMPYYYRSADIFVHTSLSEVASLVLREAMACGLPIIASNVPSIIELQGDAGLIFGKKDSEDLADKIIDLLKNEEKREALGEIGSRRIYDLGITLDKTAERYRDLYLSIL